MSVGQSPVGNIRVRKGVNTITGLIPRNSATVNPCHGHMRSFQRWCQKGIGIKLGYHGK